MDCLDLLHGFLCSFKLYYIGYYLYIFHESRMSKSKIEKKHFFNGCYTHCWQEILLWTLRCIHQYFCCSYLCKGDLTTRQISSGGGNKGLVDLFMFKKDVLGALLSSFLDEHVESAEARKLIRQTFKDHATHRQLFGWLCDTVQPDLTWHAGWKESERAALLLIEAGELQIF